MQKLTPFLWFDHDAEEAAEFYTSIFKNSSINHVARHGKGGPGREGAAMLVSFELDGVQFKALNGGPVFTFNPAISFVVSCDSQEEVDYYWRKLSESGEEVQCGWLKDKFGVSWQIVPKILETLMSDPDPARTERVMTSLLKMIKLDIAELQRAFDGK